MGVSRHFYSACKFCHKRLTPCTKKTDESTKNGFNTLKSYMLTLEIPGKDRAAWMCDGLFFVLQSGELRFSINVITLNQYRKLFHSYLFFF